MKHVVAIRFSSRDRSAEDAMNNLETALSYAFHVPVESASLMHGSIDEIISNHSDDELLFLPLIVQKGYEYEKILSYGFPAAQPLLGDESDAAEIAAILSSVLPERKDNTYLLVGHGMQNREISEYNLLRKHLRPDMRLTALKGPDDYHYTAIPDTEITIIPFLLTCGYHVKNDIVKTMIPYLAKRGKNVTLCENGLLNLSSGFAEIFRRHLAALLNE